MTADGSGAGTPVPVGNSGGNALLRARGLVTRQTQLVGRNRIPSTQVLYLLPCQQQRLALGRGCCQLNFFVHKILLQNVY